MSIPQTMRAAQFPSAHSELQVVNVPVPTISEDEVLIKVQACGVCHGDIIVEDGHFPGLTYPRIPGHEIIGRIVKMGNNVPQSHININDLVGVGWHDQHCFKCHRCVKGDFGACAANMSIPTGTGISRDGGYAEYASVRWEAIIKVPEEYSNRTAEAAPLVCAGLTVFNSLRNAEVSPGDVVLVQGVGGLGHLAIQYASRLGYYTIALTTSSDKEKLALELGAKEALLVQPDGSHLNRIRQLGGAKVIMATAPDSKSISSLVSSLSYRASLLILAAPNEPLSINSVSLIMNSSKIVGWSSGLPHDAEDTLKFSLLSQVVPTVQTFSLEDASEAYKAMKNNTVRFRSVIVP